MNQRLMFIKTMAFILIAQIISESKHDDNINAIAKWPSGLLANRKPITIFSY